MDKYLKGRSVFSWIRNEVFTATNASIVWNGILDVIPLIKPCLHWRIGDGSRIRIGIDRFVGGGEFYLLSDSLVNLLHEKGYYTLEHISTNAPVGTQWIGASALRLVGDHILEWSRYLTALKRMGIFLSQRQDELVWIHNKTSGCITVKSAYDHIYNPLNL